MSSIPFLVGGLALSCVFTSMALYQVQAGIDAYLRQTYAGAPQSALFPGEIIAVVGGLAMLGLLVVGGTPRITIRPASSLATSPPLLLPTNSPPPSTAPNETPAPIPTSGNVLSMTSEPGDYIGQGHAVTLSSPQWRFSAAQVNGVDKVSIGLQSGTGATYHWWTVVLAAPPGQPLAVGTYRNAQRAPFRMTGSPGLDVGGEGRGCNRVFGSFTVTQIAVDKQGNVQGFEASFEQHCESAAAPALHGYVRFGTVNSSQQAQTERAVARLG
jgi:hypothetical protein